MVELMEYFVDSWEENIPLKSSIRLLSHITSVDYDKHMVGEAVKCYLALKDLDTDNDLNCVRSLVLEFRSHPYCTNV